MSYLTLLILLPLVLAFLVLSLRDPIRLVLPIYAALIPFGSGLSIGLPGAFGSVSSLFGIVLAIGLLVQLVTLRRGAARIPADVPVWLAFLGLTGATVFWSIAPQLTATSFEILGSLVLLSVLLVISGITRAELIRTATALLVGGVVAACYGLAQLLVLGGLPSSDEGSPRFGNDLLGPNNQAAALLLPLTVAMARMAAKRGRRRAAYLAAATVLLAGVVLTGSRGGLLAAVLVVAVMIAFTGRGRHVLAGYAVGGALLLVAVLVLNPAGVGERQLQSEQTSSGRAEIWAVGFSACSTYCLGGSGWGTFARVYATERASVPEARVLKRGTSFEAHNIWILAGVEAGVLGFVLVTLILGMSLRTALRLPKPARAPPLAALLGTMFSGIFLSNIEFKFFWMVLVYVVLWQQVSSAAEARTEPAVAVGS